jgi:hypothetical protein
VNIRELLITCLFHSHSLGTLGEYKPRLSAFLDIILLQNTRLFHPEVNYDLDPRRKVDYIRGAHVPMPLALSPTRSLRIPVLLPVRRVVLRM